jgi:hypothetical protein
VLIKKARDVLFELPYQSYFEYVVFLKLCGISHHRAAIGRENTRELLWDDLQEKQNNERERKRERQRE